MRRICRPAAMLLSLILLALAMPAGSGGAENALPAGRLLLIRDAAYDPESGILTVKWKNTGSVTVTGAEIRIHPVDAEGAPVIIGEGEIEDILLEERVLRAFTPVEHGKEAAVSFGAGELYPGAAGMEIALDRIEQTVSTGKNAWTAASSFRRKFTRSIRSRWSRRQPAPGTPCCSGAASAAGRKAARPRRGKATRRNILPITNSAAPTSTTSSATGSAAPCAGRRMSAMIMKSAI